MIDLKKLVTGFLILASLAGSLSFIFSDYTPTVATSNDIAKINFPSNESSLPPKNAFVETIPSPKPQLSDLATNNQPQELPPPSTLTDLLTQSLIREVIEVNPQGPIDAGGQFNVAEPDVAVLMKKMANDPIVKKLQIPDWEADAKAITFRVIESPTAEDIENYSAVVQDLVDKHFIQNGLVGRVGQQSPDELFRTGEIFAGAIKDMRAMAVPEKLAALHGDGIRVLLYMRNAIDLAKNAQDDPMKSMLVFSANEKNYNQMVWDFVSEYQKVKDSGIISFDKKSSGIAAVINSVLGIKIAHAQYPTFDFGGSLATFLNDIKKEILEFIKTTLLTVLKQLVVKNLLNQVVSFVQGNGTPLFITNWKSFLQDTFNAVAGAAIGEVWPNLCEPFRLPIKISLENTFIRGTNGSLPTSCSLDQLVDNIEGFYLNFQTGGWIAYGAVTMPSGNYFGNLFATHEKIARDAQQGADAKKNEGQASGGFLSVKQCPSGFIKDTAGGPNCINADFDIADPINVTPGSAVATHLFDKLKAPGETLNNESNSWAALFSTFIGQVLDAVINRGLSNLLGAAKF